MMAGQRQRRQRPPPADVGANQSMVPELYEMLAGRTAAAAGGGGGVGYSQLLGWLGGDRSRRPTAVLEQVRWAGAPPPPPPHLPPPPVCTRR